MLSRHLLSRLLQPRRVEETRRRRSQLGRRRGEVEEEKRRKRVEVEEEERRRRRNEEEEERIRRRVWEGQRRRRDDQDPSPSIVYPQVSHQVMYARPVLNMLFSQFENFSRIQLSPNKHSSYLD